MSPDQALQINTVMLNRATRMDSLKNNLSADKKENHLAARSIMLSTQRQVLAVLDDNQKQKFMEWEKMRKEKHREKERDVNQKSEI